MNVVPVLVWLVNTDADRPLVWIDLEQLVRICPCLSEGGASHYPMGDGYSDGLQFATQEP